MKKIILFVIICFGFSCSLIGSGNSDIDIVKKTLFYENLTVEQFVNTCAGMNGSVKWSAFTPKDQGENVGCVEVNVITTMKDKSTKHLLLQYLVKRETKVVKLHTAEVNEKPVSMVELIFETAEMMW
ncbi:MAG: hypothetical protein JXN64_04885 [Spirochaetes bacterium]|nr:hypothetical protein [Spirochaetota bacterium]